MRAVITAGGLVGDPFAATAGTPVKALAPVHGTALLDLAVAACAGAGCSGIAVVGGPEVRVHLAGTAVTVIDAAADGRTNVLRALDAWPGERFVYLSSDLPDVTAPGLRDFIDRSEPFALTMALADAAAYAVRYPGAPPHEIALRGGRFANGSAFVFGTEAVGPARAFAVRAFAARKNLLALSRMLGPALVLRYLTRRLRLSHIEAYARRTLGVAAAAVRDCDPGLCFDVDTLDDYRYACSRV